MGGGGPCSVLLRPPRSAWRLVSLSLPHTAAAVNLRPSVCANTSGFWSLLSIVRPICLHWQQKPRGVANPRTLLGSETCSGTCMTYQAPLRTANLAGERPMPSCRRSVSAMRLFIPGARGYMCAL
ncbi:uncharacterized protein LY79DRAFT_325245 [Colletotrichum navitas]|uniref:Uncharacterized protein n=1 Tax=Colletotrichum navitas TaxID=681940 RepID=A0AAD8QB37_9PEZI|nr:uncharacterized protein LY79DRAFT_325245 [Colletotrichum navitas]KAK1598003.1 hypothetical protein LY79DRAFT_325245 [Colletotrichum navitas]